MGRQKWQEWAEDEERIKVLTAWARAGKTDEEIAKAIGISRSTLSEWKKKYDGIRTALSTGKDYADRLVENSLYKMALGYTVTNKKAIKTKHVKYKDGRKISEDEEIEYADETQHISSDVRAIMFWLENRMPEWRKQFEKVNDSEGTEGAGTIIMDTTQARDIKKMIEDEKNRSEKAENQEGK